MRDETASEIDERIEQRMGATFHELCEDSRRCLRTQVFWSTVSDHLAAQMDGAPAVDGVKALELEMRLRVVTAAFVAAVRSDLAEGSYPAEVARRIRQHLGDLEAERLTFGQCVGILGALGLLRRRDPFALHRSRVGGHLRQLNLSYTLVDSQFVSDLFEIVELRNRVAHRAMAIPDVAPFEALLLGENGGGLLPFLVRASRTR